MYDMTSRHVPSVCVAHPLSCSAPPVIWYTPFPTPPNTTKHHQTQQILGLTYPINLLVNFALRLWGLRENIVGLLFDMDAMRLPLSTFYMVTYASLVMVFALSVAVPSVWFLVEVIGSTACMVFAYVFPALLLATGEAGGGAWGRAGGAGLLLVAAVVAVFGTINAFASLG